MTDERRLSIPYYVWAPIVVAIGPLVGGIASHIIRQDSKIRDLEETRPAMVSVDRDNVPDMVIGDRIFLADETEEGVRYHQLTDSDRYRIAS